MRVTRALCKTLTLFTRKHCGLCDEAKVVVNELKAQYQFKSFEIDIDEPRNKKWYDLYMFDVPVLHIEHDGRIEKLWHRMDRQRLISMLDK